MTNQEEIMNTIYSQHKVGMVGLIFLLAAMSCSLLPIASTGEVQTESQTIDLDGASSANVQIEMDAGELSVGGGAVSLMEATFRYNVEDWQPKVDYSINSDLGQLVVNQPDKDNRLAGPAVVNVWDIHLNDLVPLILEIRTGAGQTILELSSMDFSNLVVEVGAGEVNVDLSGSWDHDVTASINGGVGNLTVTLPADFGVRVNLATGIGNVTTAGLTQESGGYVNQAYGNAPYSLTLDIHTGVGSIELIAP
jgi:hypothetical protein